MSECSESLFILNGWKFSIDHYSPSIIVPVTSEMLFIEMNSTLFSDDIQLNQEYITLFATWIEIVTHQIKQKKQNMQIMKFIHKIDSSTRHAATSKQQYDTAIAIAITLYISITVYTAATEQSKTERNGTAQDNTLRIVQCTILHASNYSWHWAENKNKLALIRNKANRTHAYTHRYIHSAQIFVQLKIDERPNRYITH